MRHVFVSYSHKDNDFAQLLRTELQNAGIQTWLALENIKAGEDWKGEIDDAIKSSFALVVIISPASDQSKYVTYEWALAYGFGIPIIPILYKQLDSPQKPHPRLESLQYEDFTTNINRPWNRIIDRLTEIHNELLRKEKLDPKVAEAIQALDNWDSQTIIRAAKMLGQRKIQSAIPKLEKLLDDPDHEIQSAAIKALGEIGSLQEIDKIITLVDKAETRLSAIEALGKLGDIKAESILLRYIGSDDEQVQVLCINALKNIPSPAFKEQLLGLLQKNFDWENERVLTNIFDALGDRVTKDDVFLLMEILKKSSPDISVGIIDLLGESRDERSLPHVLKLTRHDSRSVSQAAYSAIEKMVDFKKKLQQLSSGKKEEQQDSINFFYQYFGLDGLLYILAYSESEAYWDTTAKIEEVVKESDADILIEALQDSTVRVRGLTAEVIGRRKFAALCNKLKPLANDDYPFVRGLAIRTIGKLKCSRSISVLKERLKDTSQIFSNSNDEVRDFAAIALANLRHKDALPRLRELVFDNKSNLQEEATDLFIALGGVIANEQLESMLYENNPTNRIVALKILASLQKIDFNVLVKTLNSKDNKESEDAIDQLSNLYMPLGLIVMLAHNDIESYWKIAEKLRKLLRFENAPLIIQFLSDKNHRVRALLADILGSRPDLNLAEHLVPLIDDKVSFVRGLAIRALGKLKYEPAKDSLLLCLNDKENVYSNSDIRVCDYAVVALANIGAEISLAFLDSFKKNSYELMHQIIEANKVTPLIVHRDFIVELLRILQSGEAENNFSTYAIRLIGEFGRAEDAGILLDYLAKSNKEDWSVVEDAVTKIADKTIVPRALSYLSVDDEHLRMACLDILEAHGDNTVIEKVLQLFAKSQINGNVLFRAINVLSAHGDLDLLEIISAFSESEEEVIRRSVVAAYGKLQDKDSRSRIIPFLKDQSYIVRASAVKALINLADPENLAVIMESIEIGIDSKDYFKYEYDMACLEAIGNFGKNEHLPILRDAALGHEYGDCRAIALQALNLLKDEDLQEISIRMLSDDGYSYEYDMPVSRVAANILRTINTEEARLALNSWLSELEDDEKPNF